MGIKGSKSRKETRDIEESRAGDAPPLLFSPGRYFVGESRYSNMFDEIMSEKLDVIGVYGRKGSGKTSLLQYLYNKLASHKPRYDHVIFVWSCESIDSIQDQIARGLGLRYPDWNHYSTTHKCILIWKALIGTKFAILFDDLSRPIKWEDIGFEFDSYTKVVFTTTNKALCGFVSSDLNIPVGTLPSDEAWSLFSLRVALDRLGPEIEPYAKEAVQMCEGSLPLLIEVAKALRRFEEIHVWEKAIQIMRGCRERKQKKNAIAENPFPALENEEDDPLSFYDELWRVDNKIFSKWSYA